MGQFFAEEHASPESQFENTPHDLTDTPQVQEKRDAADFEGLMELGKALCWQLRHREAVEVYSKAIRLRPEEISGYRQRAARYITTLQPEKAISDFLRCRELGGDPHDLCYRLGICHYLSGDYGAAMEELEVCYPLCDEDMGIAVIFWHTLSAWRCGKEPTLLREKYYPGMDVGHHISYEFVMRTASGNLSLMDAVLQLGQERSDLEYSIKAYGIYAILMKMQETDLAQMLLEVLIKRDKFWISYAYIAAWNDNRG